MWPGTGGKEGLILSISLLGLEDLLGIQLEQVPCHQQALQVKASFMESWVFLNVGAVVIAKSHNLSEPQVVSYMLDWNANMYTFSWKWVPWLILCLSISQQYWIWFLLLFSGVWEIACLFCCAPVLLIILLGWRDVFSPLCRTEPGLGGSLAFAVVLHGIFSCCTPSPCQMGECDAGYGHFVEACFWPHLNLLFKIFYCHNDVAGPGSVDRRFQIIFLCITGGLKGF